MCEDLFQYQQKLYECITELNPSSQNFFEHMVSRYRANGKLKRTHNSGCMKLRLEVKYSTTNYFFSFCG